MISPWQKAMVQNRRISPSFSLCCMSFHKVTKLKAKEMFIKRVLCFSLWFYICPTKARLWPMAAGNASSGNGSFVGCFSVSRACVPRHSPSVSAGSAVCITTSWWRKNTHHRKKNNNNNNKKPTSTCSPTFSCLTLERLSWEHLKMFPVHVVGGSGVSELWIKPCSLHEDVHLLLA